jgi:hypothetical protein
MGQELSSIKQQSTRTKERTNQQLAAQEEELHCRLKKQRKKRITSTRSRGITTGGKDHKA